MGPMQQNAIISLYLVQRLSAKVLAFSLSSVAQACNIVIILRLSFVPPSYKYRLYNVGAETPNNVFIEPIHLLTHYSQPTLDMSNINIHKADWLLLLHWIYSMVILFRWKLSGSIPTPFLRRIRKEGDLYGFWIAWGYQCVFFVAAWPLGIAKPRSIWYYIKRTARECGRHLLVERWGKRQSERQAARCHQCREMGVKRMKTYKWKSIREGRKA